MQFDHRHQLSAQGLNIFAVFNLNELPPALIDILKQNHSLHQVTQLILVGHQGQRLWEQLQQFPEFERAEDPIDQFSQQQIHHYLSSIESITTADFLYPSDKPINLQAFGELAGWHYPSPFKIGINNAWGSWFAYRALILTDSAFETTGKLDSSSPCLTCEDQPCIQACPADALAGTQKSLQTCIDFRLQDASVCAVRCLARNACPVKTEYQYDEEQIAYHYQQSLNMIRRWQEEGHQQK